MINRSKVMEMIGYQDYTRNSVLRLMGAVIPSLPFLGFRLFREYLRYKSTADRAGRIFFDELIAQGINPQYADDLTCSYLESRNLLNFMPKMKNKGC